MRARVRACVHVAYRRRQNRQVRHTEGTGRRVWCTSRNGLSRSSNERSPARPRPRESSLVDASTPSVARPWRFFDRAVVGHESFRRWLSSRGRAARRDATRGPDTAIAADNLSRALLEDEYIEHRLGKPSMVKTKMESTRVSSTPLAVALVLAFLSSVGRCDASESIIVCRNTCAREPRGTLTVASPT